MRGVIFSTSLTLYSKLTALSAIVACRLDSCFPLPLLRLGFPYAYLVPLATHWRLLYSVSIATPYRHCWVPSTQFAYTTHSRWWRYDYWIFKCSFLIFIANKFPLQPPKLTPQQITVELIWDWWVPLLASTTIRWFLRFFTKTAQAHWIASNNRITIVLNIEGPFRSCFK